MIINFKFNINQYYIKVFGTILYKTNNIIIENISYDDISSG